MMQIGGIDNLVMKNVTLPSENEKDDKKIIQQQDKDIAAKEAEKKADEREDALKAERAEETEKEVYGDVVARSTDGDTTRVKKDALEALESGMVFHKDEKENMLMEFNRDQLTVMLDKGDITKNEYNHEILRRDEIMEKDEKSAFAKSNAEMIEQQKEEAQKKAEEKAKERLEELQNGGSENEEKANALEKGMNMLAAGAKGLEIEEEAVENAAANNRSEIIDQILNPDEEAGLKVIIK
ncbi:MAG: hypothetical protein K6F73_05135 [Lachnospiraceae bacterium]|nr:hypothetical protein [Lachnospiraceae bacterium]